MSALTSVRLLIRIMSAEERSVARNFLTAFSIRGSKAPNQAAKLFDLLCREISGGTMLEDRQIERLIYHHKSGSAFIRLIFRLRDKLYESLSLSVNLERPNAYSVRGRVLMEIRKEISHAQILQDRGAWSEALSILDDCVEKAEKYEHYEEWAAALRVRFEMRAIDKGRASFDEENKLYEKVIRGLIASKKALEYYHKLGTQIEFKAGQVDLDELSAHIADLQLEFEKTNSGNVAFFLHYLEVHFYQEFKMYKSASRILKRLVTLVEKHPAVSSPFRLAGVYINLAWNEIYVRKFLVAVKHSSKAQDVLPDGNFNHFRCWETDFHAYYYLGKYDKALDKINALLKHDGGINSEYRTGKREYQKACTLFMLGRFQQVHKILIDLNPIEDDHDGWNLGLRTLYIMNDIELEKTENAFNRIENMRKHLEKLKKAKKEITREVLKYEILRALVNSRFDFIETRNKKREELDHLASQDEPFLWKILSPELIIFEQWFESKVFKQKLKLRIPEYVAPPIKYDAREPEIIDDER